jgi:hypothetical protein
MNNLVIGGSGRSGTTILAKIFSEHPEFVIVPEWRFLIDPGGVLDFYIGVKNLWTPYIYDKKLNDLINVMNNIKRKNYLFVNKLDSKLKKHFNIRIGLLPQYSTINPYHVSPNFKEIVNSFLNELVGFKYNCQWSGSKFLEKTVVLYGHYDFNAVERVVQNFIINVKKDVLLASNKSYYLEKNTWNILIYDRLLDLMPDSKLIHMYRDPRDVISSFMKQKWMPSDLEKSIIIYKDIMMKWNEIKSNIPVSAFIEVSLEKLVHSPEKEIKRICEFWNVKWDDSLMKTDLSKSNQGRWKKDMEKNQIKYLESNLINEIEEYGAC